MYVTFILSAAPSLGPFGILGIYRQAKTWLDAVGGLFRRNKDKCLFLGCSLRIFHIVVEAKPLFLPSK
jgi:hypothetical protein